MGDPPTRVVIVGAGPVGLTAAAVLVSRGVPVTVLESAPVPQTDWRASTFHAATLELLDDIDVTGEMHERGLVVPRYQYRDRREGLVAEFDFSVLADGTRYPYRLQLNQQQLVVMLLNRLSGHPLADIRFGNRVVDVAQDRSGAAARAETDGGSRWVSGDFLLGADGASSVVRRQLDVAFEGMTYPQRFVIVSVAEDFRDDCVPDLADVCYVADPEEFLFILRTPDSWRMLFPVADEPDEVVLSDERLQRVLAGFHPLRRPYGILDRQIYGVHQRVARTFRVGNVLLLGDAAHINSPLGGMGLNCGIHDAMDAGRRIARIAGGGAEPAAELQTYGRRRRTVALDYVRADTHRNTTMMQERDPQVRRANHADLAAIAADPVRHREWLLRASMLAPVAKQGIGEPPSRESVTTGEPR